MSKSVFTTGEVAGYCGVSADTVSRWFDLGQIEGYRLGPGGDRRIPRDKLREFMQKHGIPLDRLNGETAAILVLDDNPYTLETATRALGNLERFGVYGASTGFECGLRVAELNPQLIVLDLELSDVDPCHLCKRVKERNETHFTAILGVGTPALLQNPQSFLDAGVDALLAKPFTAESLLSAVKGLLSLAPNKLKRPIAV